MKIPTASSDWHPIALDWYRSLAESGQSDYFEPSDWQAARYVAEVMSKNLAAGRFSAMLFTAVWSSMADLLTTESARRRARVEVERLGAGDDGDGEESKVTAIDEYRRKLGA